MMRPDGNVKSLVHQSHISPKGQFNNQQVNETQLWKDRY